jgi:hypothetical protein
VHAPCSAGHTCRVEISAGRLSVHFSMPKVRATARGGRGAREQAGAPATGSSHAAAEAAAKREAAAAAVMESAVASSSSNSMQGGLGARWHEEMAAAQTASAKAAIQAASGSAKDKRALSLAAAMAAHDARVTRLLAKRKQRRRPGKATVGTTSFAGLLSALPDISQPGTTAATPLSVGLAAAAGRAAAAPAHREKAGKHVRQRPDLAAIAQFASIAMNATYMRAPVSTIVSHLGTTVGAAADKRDAVAASGAAAAAAKAAASDAEAAAARHSAATAGGSRRGGRGGKGGKPGKHR